MKKNTIKAVLFFIVAAILLTLGIIILPEVTNIGLTILHILIGLCILAYAYGFLLTKVVIKSKGTILVLSLVELILLTFIAVTCILKTWISISFIDEGCLILGLAFWIRGVVESFRSHLSNSTSGKKYAIYKVVMNILLITVGTWIFVSPIFTNHQLLYVFAGVFICSCITCIVLGVLKLKK